MWVTLTVDDTYPSAEIFPNDFSVIRKDRTSGGGGVFLAFTKNLKFTEQPNLSQNAKMIWAEIYPVSNESCFVCSFYRPPDALSSPIISLKEALQHISRTKGNQTNIILAGDFNFPSIEWSNGIGHVKPGPTYGAEVNNLFVDVINDFSLEQQVFEPTRNENVLNLVLTTSPYVPYWQHKGCTWNVRPWSSYFYIISNLQNT